MCKVPAKGVSEKVKAEISKSGFEVATELPFDDEIYDHITSGESLLGISTENSVYNKIKDLMNKLETVTTDK
jgi:MinD superfamily P-loop ATPase